MIQSRHWFCARDERRVLSFHNFDFILPARLCLAFFAPKECWKLASHIIAELKPANPCALKERWKMPAIHAARYKFILFATTNHFEVG
jgi:hypothetical protein